MDRIRICSYNMHGYNQGRSFLSELCSLCHVILLQEHWLQPAECDKLRLLNNDFITVSTSAMDTAVQTGIVRGRPFGGVGIMIHKRLASTMVKLLCSERLIIIRIGSLLLVNVYLPPSGTDLYVEAVSDVLFHISNVLEQQNSTYVVIGGDFNIDFSRQSVGSELLCQFMKDHRLAHCDDLMQHRYSYTYHHGSLDSSSFIDHFLVSDGLRNLVIDGDICDSGFNLSDHLAINLDINMSPIMQQAPSYQTSNAKHYRLRWDKADTVGYYSLTYNYLYNIDINRLDSSVNNKFSVTMIDDLCNQIVCCLNEASRQCVPRTSCRFFKHWWNDALTSLKDDSLQAHRLWEEHGCPRNGPIYNAKRCAKAKYKQMLRKTDKEEIVTLSNDLHDYLNKKDQNAFWQTWNSKFGKTTGTTHSLAGCTDETVAANKFADLFASVCMPTNNANSDKLRDTFLRRYQDYTERQSVDISVELIDSCIRRMKTGKAAGCDNIETEHLLYAHPILVLLLKVLFSAIIKHGYVPDIFCQGIVIPLVKDKQGNAADVTNYRGITLSSTISKVFEMCLLEMYGNVLYSEDLQFGFKKNLGCNNAIYTVKSLCDYYTSRGSTVNVCCLDMSKAFDKVNHYSLFCKLMNRKTPVEFINVLINWYSRCTYCVRVGMVLSHEFRSVCGVRQGGVLSPLLFAVYVNDIIVQLRAKRLGCCIGDLYLGCVMYADDLILMSSSLTVLQKMIDVCVSEATSELDMSFNAKKSAIIRVGRRYKNECKAVKLCGTDIPYESSTRYLGVFLCAAKQFKMSAKQARASFYKSLNLLLSRGKGKFDDIVMLHLIKTFCLPLLLYGSECLDYTSSYDSCIMKSWNYIFWKLFQIHDGSVNEICSTMNMMTIDDILFKRRCNFRLRMLSSSNTVVRYLCDIQFIISHHYK